VCVGSTIALAAAASHRDRYIREKLRSGQPPWRVEELTARDLAGGEALVTRLMH